LLDYEKINEFKSFSDKKYILEIGAGSGRTSEAILTFNSNIKYTICDIPPALFVSYERLKKVFNTKKIGLLYDLQDSVELNNSINNFDISFIMPHQLNLIKNNNFDLTIAIDCVHEMDKKTIQNYFTNINNISKLFYFSVWKKTTVPFSGILRKFSFFGILKLIRFGVFRAYNLNLILLLSFLSVLPMIDCFAIVLACKDSLF
jgi:SAM-dependent methyltransferase